MVRRLVVDAAIPLAEEAFSRFGTVELVPGREITAAHVAGADALVVRSVTRVDAALLVDSAVRFVGTATIGTDHLDIPWLESAGVRWASAAGCNARSVVEYVLSATGAWCAQHERGFAGLRLGIVGHGNIGSRLAPVARALGITVSVCDPPLERAGKLSDAVALETILAECDVVTLHVPYTRSGPDATHHLLDTERLALLHRPALLINAARGAAINNAALLTFMMAGGQANVALDVFEGEPAPNQRLVERCWLATPHIAGYSHEGKTNGTTMMAAALAAHFGEPHTFAPSLPEPEPSRLDLAGATGLPALRRTMALAYDIAEDDGNLRRGLGLDQEGWGRHFDGLRRGYRQRREFANYTITGAGDTETARLLMELGFLLKTP